MSDPNENKASGAGESRQPRDRPKKGSRSYRTAAYRQQSPSPSAVRPGGLNRTSPDIVWTFCVPLGHNQQSWTAFRPIGFNRSPSSNDEAPELFPEESYPLKVSDDDVIINPGSLEPVTQSAAKQREFPKGPVVVARNKLPRVTDTQSAHGLRGSEENEPANEEENAANEVRPLEAVNLDSSTLSGPTPGETLFPEEGYPLRVSDDDVIINPGSLEPVTQSAAKQREFPVVVARNKLPRVTDTQSAHGLRGSEENEPANEEENAANEVRPLEAVNLDSSTLSGPTPRETFVDMCLYKPQKRILVTGGTGFIGSSVKSLTNTCMLQDEQWIFVGTKDADLSNLEETKQLFAKHMPTHVLHLAAAGDPYDSTKNNLEIMRKNLRINDNVLQTSLTTGVLKVVSCLSPCIFPNSAGTMVYEGLMYGLLPRYPNLNYIYPKMVMDAANHAYNQEHGRMFTSVIPVSTFGPNDDYRLDSKRAIATCIRQLYDEIERGKAQGRNEEDICFLVPISGKILHQFIYSFDVARLMIGALREYNSADAIILCGDEDVLTLDRIAKAVSNAFNFKGRLLCDVSETGVSYKKTVMNTQLRRLFPYFQFTPFEAAIEQTVNWFKDNQAIAKK